MRKIIALSLLSMISTAGYACNGFYIGGELGLAFAEAKVHSHVHTMSDHTFRHHLGAFGFVGGGFAGYNFDFCQWDLGIEAFITANTIDTHRRHESEDFSHRHNVNYDFNYGIRVLPGFYLMNCVEAHLIAGWTRANFSSHHHFDFSDSHHHHHRSFDIDGYQVGGGLRLDFCNNISLRFDGVFNGFSSSHHRHDFHVDDVVTASLLPPPVEHHHHSIQIYDFDATLSLIYNF